MYKHILMRLDETPKYGTILGLKKDDFNVSRLLNGKSFSFEHVEHMYCKMIIISLIAQEGSRAYEVAKKGNKKYKEHRMIFAMSYLQ